LLKGAETYDGGLAGSPSKIRFTVFFTLEKQLHNEKYSNSHLFSLQPASVLSTVIQHNPNETSPCAWEHRIHTNKLSPGDGRAPCQHIWI